MERKCRNDKDGDYTRPWKQEKESLKTLFRNLLQNLKDCRKNVGENFYRDLVVGVNVRVIHSDNSSIVVQFDFNGVALENSSETFTHNDTSLVIGEKKNINQENKDVK